MFWFLKVCEFTKKNELLSFDIFKSTTNQLYAFICSMRLILYPFSVLYALITNLRNLLFDAGILPSKTFDIPIICIGNLSVGGTGKTPLTSYIISLLEKNKVAVLSRGYGRSTSGYQKVSTESKAEKVGDESLWLKQKHPNCLVMVDENRKKTIEIVGSLQPK